MTFTTINFETTGSLGVLTLNRPERRNAINPAMVREFNELAKMLEGDESVRCLLIKGAGDGFCAGLDLEEGLAGALLTWSKQPVAEVIDQGMELAGAFEWLPRLRIPSIAAVHGFGLGAGMQLSLACDLRLFADNAKVGLAENRFGLLPDMGATFRLPRIVGDAKARELIMFGSIIDAEAALTCGLAQRVFPAAEFEAAVTDYATMLAAAAPLAVQGARRAIEFSYHNEDQASLQFAVEQQIRCLQSADFPEGLAAWQAKRPPNWQGR